jgi:hypothetical protein
LYSDNEFNFEDINFDSRDNGFFGGVDWKDLQVEDLD